MTSSETPTDTRRWQAVLERDPSFDRAFVYAVSSTGIYCRASCPSRKPARQRTLFYPTPEEAERNGFRPCQRCRPRDGEDAALGRAREVCRYLEANFQEPVTLAKLAETFGVSPYHLQRSFKRLTGLSPRQYQAHCRMQALRGALQVGEDISQATFESGFGSSSRLYSRSDAQLGMTPGSYRRKGQDMEIRYTLAESPLGTLLIAASPRGVSSVSLGDDEETLEAELKTSFSRARLERDDEGLQGEVKAVLEHLSGHRPHLSLPRDVQATAFQAQVWQALQEIPYGETRSYRQIAEAVGNPAATRAVARACASNPTALLVPCHRVVREDGDLGGYRWGEGRKRQLLERERQTRTADAA